MYDTIKEICIKHEIKKRNKNKKRNCVCTTKSVVCLKLLPLKRSPKNPTTDNVAQLCHCVALRISFAFSSRSLVIIILFFRKTKTVKYLVLKLYSIA